MVPVLFCVGMVVHDSTVATAQPPRAQRPMSPSTGLQAAAPMGCQYEIEAPCYVRQWPQESRQIWPLVARLARCNPLWCWPRHASQVHEHEAALVLCTISLLCPRAAAGMTQLTPLCAAVCCACWRPWRHACCGAIVMACSLPASKAFRGMQCLSVCA